MDPAASLRIGCLVMAAGNASRFGANKLAAELDGRTLIERALDAVPKGMFAAVCVASQYEGIEELAGKYGFAAIHNAHPDWGLSYTIRLGTQAMRACDGILYLVADQPLLRRDSVQRIAEAWLRTPEKIAGASHEGRRGNPNLFPARFFPELLALEGDCGGNLVIKRHTEDYLPVELAPEELRDCDTPQELDALRIQAE